MTRPAKNVSIPFLIAWFGTFYGCMDNPLGILRRGLQDNSPSFLVCHNLLR